MKKTLFLLALLTCQFSLWGAVGDTTWVQAHLEKQFDHYGAFDTTIEFPKGVVKYRKLIMVFTLGKYACPGSPTYCADWDYTITTQVMNKAGDTVELGRLISPYANSSYARFPLGWKERYYFDVTDFATVLKDSNTIRVYYSGYSWGFTGDIKFAMIEGTPERDVLSVQKMWDGSYSFGNSANPIDNHFTAKPVSVPPSADAAVYRMNITGHGSDATGCAEFCEKYYEVYKDGLLLHHQPVWRSDCGSNHLYPQSGTWVYDRANWCPGASVHTIFHPVPFNASTPVFNLSMKFEPYVNTGAASYTVNGIIVFYGPKNKARDVSLEEILAPTKYEGQFRENPRTGNTTVKIRNTGSGTVSSIEFEYGVTGKTLTTYTWTGSLASSTDTIINLPFALSLLEAIGADIPYEVNIRKVDGATDEDLSNDKMTTTFDAADKWPNTFMVTMRTNNSTVGSISETEWKVYAEASGGGTGTVVAQRINNSAATTYNDTITLPTGVYRFEVSDKGCDGLRFWANPSAGTGTLQVKETLFKILTLKGYFGGDFGCGFKQYFIVGNPTDIREKSATDLARLYIYPNPAQDIVHLQILSNIPPGGIVRIADYVGKTVYTERLSGAQLELSLDTRTWNNGLYLIYFESADGNRQKVEKLIIAR